MLQRKRVQSISVQQFLESQPPKVKEESLKRWESIHFSSQDIAELKAVEYVSILAYIQPTSPDCMLILPVLEKLHQINPKIHYEIIQVIDASKEQVECVEEVQTPLLVFRNQEHMVTGEILGRTKDFKKRLKGLDQEDTLELIRYYRAGKYNAQIIKEIIGLCQR